MYVIINKETNKQSSDNIVSLGSLKLSFENYWNYFKTWINIVRDNLMLVHLFTFALQTVEVHKT